MEVKPFGPARVVERRHRVPSAAFAAAILILPFVVVSIWLDFLRVQLSTFHGTDETIFHLGVIQRFAAELPWPNLLDYDSATTPFFHLIFAVALRLFGLELAGLRALNVLISIGTVLYLYQMVRHRFRLPVPDSLLVTAAFGLSPYFFGASFLALTDNLAWGLAVVSLDMALRAVEQGGRRDWFLASLALALTLLTRQSYVWVYLSLVVLALVSPGPSLRERVIRCGIALAAVAPLLPLIVVWGGLVPPTFQLGGTSGVEHRPGSSLNLVAVIYVLAVIGAYSMLLPPEDRVLVRRPGRAEVAAGVAAVVLTFALLLISPVRRDEDLHNGFLWSLSVHMPMILGTSVLLWVLVPTGLFTLYLRVTTAPTGLSSIGMLAILCMAAVSSHFVFQKYFDPAIPMLLALARKGDGRFTRWDRAAYAFLALAGLAYFVLQARLTNFG